MFISLHFRRISHPAGGNSSINIPLQKIRLLNVRRAAFSFGRFFFVDRLAGAGPRGVLVWKVFFSWTGWQGRPCGVIFSLIFAKPY